MLPRSVSRKSAWGSDSRTCALVQGRVFLDRDPKHFRLILNYLRDGDICLPSCPMELQEILQEALFYQVCCSKGCSDLPACSV